MALPTREPQDRPPHGHERVIPIGKEGQAIIEPFLLDRSPDAPLFSPAEAEAELRARRHTNRQTPANQGNTIGSNRTEQPKRKPGTRYTTCSVRRCIERACDRAFPVPKHLQDKPKAVEKWRQDHRWTPHQLRHTATTRLRREHGLEVAALVLGHASASITDAVYAERDMSKIVSAMSAAG